MEKAKVNDFLEITKQINKDSQESAFLTYIVCLFSSTIIIRLTFCIIFLSPPY